MGGETSALLPRDVYRPAPREAVAACSAEGFALVLSRLLQRPVDAASVVDRAVGLGLLRPPAAGAPARLSVETASRLLLSAYRLPALAEAATLAGVREHLAARRQVFLLLGETEPAAAQLHALLPADSPAWSLVSACAAHGPAIEEVSAEWLLDAWKAAGRLTVTAARRWEDLPTAGGRFFGGAREKDGNYHWDAADCDTDAAGRILRVW
jgi:hypothetical protein